MFTAGFTSPSVKTGGPTQTASLSLISVESQSLNSCVEQPNLWKLREREEMQQAARIGLRSSTSFSLKLTQVGQRTPEPSPKLQLCPGLAIPNHPKQDQNEPSLKYEQLLWANQPMDMYTGLNCCIQGTWTPGNPEPTRAQGKSSNIPHLRRKSTQGWQLKSSLTAHNAVPQEGLALHGRKSQLCFAEHVPANPFAPVLTLLLFTL